MFPGRSYILDRRRTISFLVGLEVFYVHGISIRWLWYIVHLLSFFLTTWSAHLCLLSLIFLITSVAPLRSQIQFALFLSFTVTPTMILSIFLWEKNPSKLIKPMYGNRINVVSCPIEPKQCKQWPKIPSFIHSFIHSHVINKTATICFRVEMDRKLHAW